MIQYLHDVFVGNRTLNFLTGIRMKPDLAADVPASSKEAKEWSARFFLLACARWGDITFFCLESDKGFRNEAAI